MESLADHADDRPDISNEVAALCRALGFEPTIVKTIWLSPGEVTLSVYRTNEEGNKYLQDDGTVALDGYQIKALT